MSAPSTKPGALQERAAPAGADYSDLWGHDDPREEAPLLEHERDQARELAERARRDRDHATPAAWRTAR